MMVSVSRKRGGAGASAGWQAVAPNSSTRAGVTRPDAVRAPGRACVNDR